MTKETLEKELTIIISEKTGSIADHIKGDDHFFKDLNLSLLEKADILQTVEEKYEFKFSEEDVRSVQTINDIIEIILDNAD